MNRRDFLETMGGVGLSFILSGCEFSKIFDPSWVTAYQISPFPEFRGWWDEISSCSHRSGNFDRIRWFHVVEDYIPCIIDGEHKLCYGIWKHPHDIYLSNIVIKWYNHGPGTAEYENARWKVKHEMLHDLLNSEKHPYIFKACNVDI